nr:hypothetical protein [Tanacetum cinerariifolium]
VDTLDDEIRRDPKREVGYGITDTWDEMLVGMPRAPTTDETELGRKMTNFVTTVGQDTDEIYAWVPSMDASDLAHSHSGGSTTFKDRGVVGGRPQETGTIHRGTGTAEDPTDSDDRVLETT